MVHSFVINIDVLSCGKEIYLICIDFERENVWNVY